MLVRRAAAFVFAVTMAALVACSSSSTGATTCNGQGQCVCNESCSQKCESGSGGGNPAASRIAIRAAPVDAGYASRYNYDLQAASTVKFKVVPVPPSAHAESLRIVPRLLGLTYRQAQQKLAAFNLPFTISGLGIEPTSDEFTVTQQSPQPGEILTSGAVAIGF